MVSDKKGSYPKGHEAGTSPATMISKTRTAQTAQVYEAGAPHLWKGLSAAAAPPAWTYLEKNESGPLIPETLKPGKGSNEEAPLGKGSSS